MAQALAPPRRSAGSRADAARAEAERSDLERADLERADLDRAGLKRADLDRADLKQADLGAEVWPAPQPARAASKIPAIAGSASQESTRWQASASRDNPS
ncbi:MAG TPA: pentapeptide repeat-containing protein [Methylobacterium sp.]|nr:pentapeptide repeat-containing protein [Methylobacterium sp.]